MSLHAAPHTKTAPRKKIRTYKEVMMKLEQRGYPSYKAKGMYYWIWELTTNFPVYCDQTKLGSTRLFVDGAHADLVKVLSTIKGVVPPDTGVTKNGKFERFAWRVKHFRTGLPEHEGWRFQFKDEIAVENFLDTCEEFALNGIEAAILKAASFEQKTPRNTVREIKVSTRVGQNSFREKVIAYWKTCAVTSCNLTSILKASHIKPWAASNALERLDPLNGLLLSPNLDSLFDSGYISFSEDGAILISTNLTSQACEVLGISPLMRLRKVNTAQLPYLSYHRNSIFMP